ncbi:magnesium transporter [Calderihabitans maritimus]|uniref:Magnesium transporter MgtE n=1 Tax=Calderihabitans maritimus TaxID=1246530 RepID=A0A1Z5HVT5_9FIRM|nr:magnesium transporter [Calderihabitans maritimus]GAW93431.1 magnesium transporter [Calderihabitans maritimus]
MLDRKDFSTKANRFLAENNLEKLTQLLTEQHPADIAEFLQELDSEKQGIVFSLLDREKAALVLNELDASTISSLLDTLGAERIAEILDVMPTDDAADLLGEMSDLLKQRLLGLMELEDAQDVQELMEYKKDTAGGIMTTEYVAIREDITAERAIQVLRETAPDAETVYYVYVVNTKNQLVGVISLRELIVADPNTLIADIMHRNVIRVNVNDDQEEVARVVARYDFLAVPVVDDEGSLVGIVTVDDIIDVIHDEATEDIFRLSGTSELPADDGDIYHSVLVNVRSRLPWLIITMLGGLLAGRILKGIESQLSTVVALAFFIPILTGMGGNIGTQSSSLTVRGLATGHVDEGAFFQTIIRQAAAGLVMGVLIGTIVGLVAAWWQGKVMFGVVVGLALVGNMLTAATMGTLVPLIFRKLGVDPAVASAPFISTAIDITGLLIYSTLASLLLSYLV